ncbi:anti-virulence regulator CigR family protein [Enterobacteriaceae bacterium TYF_5]|uniref:anti-virulence regulator CigR family protein n=2 Tax=Morganellaceae TaxID=1903414 RepID=UPI00370A3E13
MRRLTQVCNAVLLMTGLLAVPVSSYADRDHDKRHGHRYEHNHGHYKHRDNHYHKYKKDLTYAQARWLASENGLPGYHALPPGIAKNLARGKPLPPGIAKRAVPAHMRDRLPHYPGYEWKIAGDDLVLIALSTAVVTYIINDVFE